MPPRASPTTTVHPTVPVTDPGRTCRSTADHVAAASESETTPAAGTHARVQHGVQHDADHGDAEREIGRVLIGQRGVQHERRQQRGPRPQDDDAAAVTVAEVHQPVVEVPLVRRRQARHRSSPGERWRTACRRSARRGSAAGSRAAPGRSRSCRSIPARRSPPVHRPRSSTPPSAARAATRRHRP